MSVSGVVLTEDVVEAGVAMIGDADAVADLLEVVLGVDTDVCDVLDAVQSRPFSDSIHSTFLWRWSASLALCLPFLDAGSMSFSSQ
jgi:hypothetical protein